MKLCIAFIFVYFMYMSVKGLRSTGIVYCDVEERFLSLFFPGIVFCGVMHAGCIF
jgi:hypothetical protein